MNTSGDSFWEYECPQFVDFANEEHHAEDENLEDYFNYDHEQERHGASRMLGLRENQIKQEILNDEESPRRSPRLINIKKEPNEPSRTMTRSTSSSVPSKASPKKPVKRLSGKSITRARSLSTSDQKVAKPRSASTGNYSAERKTTESKTKPIKKPQIKQSILPSRTKLTRPVTPPLLKRKPAGSAKNQKTSEELELEKMNEMRQALANKKKLAAESLKKSKECARPVRPATTITKPLEFHFKTDDRIKSVPSSNERKRKTDAPGDVLAKKFVSMAEGVVDFAKRTPQRFHSKKKGDVYRVPQKLKAKVGDKKLTAPTTPQLSCATRARPLSYDVTTAEEREEMELKEMKEHAFKAHPVNNKILHGKQGVPRARTRSLTQPVTPKLGLRRNNSFRASRDVQESPHKFKAQPIPKDVLEGPKTKPLQPAPVTVPASPAFSLKNRLRPRAVTPLKEQEEHDHIIRANPVRFFGVPFQPQLHHKSTAVAPFSFESRNKARMSDKEKKIQQVIEDEAKLHEFHANPLPSLSPHGIPSKASAKVTEALGFHLETDVRGAHKAEEWKHKIEEELKEQKKAAQFHAHPADVIKKDPFKVKRSSKPLIEINEFHLATDDRAEKRAEWETAQLELRQEKAAAQQARERQREQEELQEAKRLREQAVHKAKPIRQYKSVQSKEVLPLTTPHTPRFSKRLARL